MNVNFKSRYARYFKWGLILFVALFAFRLGYGFFSGGNDGDFENSGSFFSGIENLRKNYASEKMQKMPSAPLPNQAPDFSTNQKYEKTASLKSKSSHFEQDKLGVDKLTKDFRAVVQYEKNEGKKGSREIHLLIGVNPMLFDSFYVQIQKIGQLKATEITKVDKTNEFRQLNAQKVSLEKTLNSLNELKARGGAISDYVSLHDKILEIEKQLQGLGVELGNFDSENEFCSIRFSLYEGATTRKISILHRVKVALEWTLKYYAFAIFGLLCWSIFAFMLLFIIDRFNILRKLVEKAEE